MTQRTPLGFLIAEVPDSGRDWKKRKEYGAQIEHPEPSNGCYQLTVKSYQPLNLFGLPSVSLL